MLMEKWMSVSDVEKKYKRTGTCDYKKCGAACCRFMDIGVILNDEHEKYLSGFPKVKFIELNGWKHIVIDAPCKNLNLETFECKIQENKSAACSQFPMPHDSVFKLVQEKCSYQFEQKEEILMGKKRD